MLDKSYLILSLELISISKIIYVSQGKIFSYLEINLFSIYISCFLLMIYVITKFLLHLKIIKITFGVYTNLLKFVAIWIVSQKCNSISIQQESSLTLVFEVIIQNQIVFQQDHNQFTLSAILISISMLNIFDINNIFKESLLPEVIFDAGIILFEIVLAINMRVQQKESESASQQQTLRQFETTNQYIQCLRPKSTDLEKVTTLKKGLIDYLQDQHYIQFKGKYQLQNQTVDLNHYVIGQNENCVENILELFLGITLKKQNCVETEYYVLQEYLENIYNDLNSFTLFSVSKNPIFDFRNILLGIYYDSINNEFLIHFIDSPIQQQITIEYGNKKEIQVADLCRSLSHELGTNLNSIVTYSNLAMQDIQIPEQTKFTYFDPILINSNQLNLIVSHIRDFNLFYLNQFILKLEEFDILNEIKFVESLFIDTLKSKQLDLVHPHNLQVITKITSDKQRFRQIFFQIFSNAVRFTNQGSISVSVEGSNQLCIVSVTDTGIGLNNEELEKMSNLLKSSQFIKVSQHSVGSGIGLKIANMIVKQMNSKGVSIKCHSSQHGTTFTFIITNNFKQLSNQSSKQSKEFKSSKSIIHFVSANSYFESQRHVTLKFGQSHKNSISLQQDFSSQNSEQNLQINADDEVLKIQSPPLLYPNLQSQVIKFSLQRECCSKILIVDDEYFNIQCLKLLMRKFHSKCESAFNGRQALDMIIKKKENQCKICGNQNYPLIFLDVNMPVMDGLETVHQIKGLVNRGELAKCYCIANTGYSDLDTKIRCYEAGMDFFLTKPLEYTQLYELIMRLFPII